MHEATELSNIDPALAHCWHPVARSSELRDEPRRVLLLGQPWVLIRTSHGVSAFADRCPHRRAPLSLGTCEGDTLRCAYHGWRFDSTGSCVEIPALGPEATLPTRARLDPPFGVEERHGMVFLAPESPVAPLGAIPEADDPSFAVGELEPTTARASVGLLADNFLDVAHFPFVHRSTFGADEALEVPQYSVVRDGWSFTSSYQHSFANREDPAVATGLRPLVQQRRLTYRLDAPFHLALRIEFLDAGGTLIVGFFLQPETEDRCRLYTTIWRDDLGGDAERMTEAMAFEQAVLDEDLVVQQSYDKLALPLSPKAETHTRADRTTVELRRVLSDLVDAVTMETVKQRSEP